MATSTSNQSAAKKNSAEPVDHSIDEAVEHIRGAASSVKQAATTLSKNSVNATNEQLLKGQEAAIEASNKGSEWIKERPYTSVGIAFAVGALLTGLIKK